MSALKLYELAAQHRSLEALADSGDVPEEVIRDTLESLEGDIEDKVRSVAHMVKNLELIADGIKDSAKAQATRAVAVQKRADSIREYLLFQLLAMDKKKIPYAEFTVAVRDNPVSVLIDPAAQVPERFMVTPEPVPYADKKALKAALESGEEVEGVKLQRGQRVEIM